MFSKLVLLTLLSTTAALARQYPEVRNYDSADRGFRQYQATSVHRTGQFALTYDDGPHISRTPRLLDLLKLHKVKATFFVVTSRITEQTFPIVKRMLDEGHIVASHGREHLNSNEITDSVWRQNLTASLNTLKSVYERAGHDWNGYYYRFPYAAYGTRSEYHHMNSLQAVSNQLFGDNCLQFAFWDVDSNDWVPSMTPEDIFQTLRAHNEGGRYFGFRTVRNSQGQVTYVKVPQEMTNPPQGGVILMHDIHERTLEGTRLFLEYVKKEGLKITSLPEIQEYAIQRECRFL